MRSSYAHTTASAHLSCGRPVIAVQYDCISPLGFNRTACLFLSGQPRCTARLYNLGNTRKTSRHLITSLGFRSETVNRRDSSRHRRPKNREVTAQSSQGLRDVSTLCLRATVFFFLICNRADYHEQNRRDYGDRRKS